MTILSQEKTYEMGRWSLDDLFPGHNSDEMQAAFAGIEARVEAFVARRPELSEDTPAETVLELVKELEAMMLDAYRIYGYAGLWFNADTQNQQAQSFIARVEQFFAQMENQTLFFSLWWKALDDNKAEALMAEAGEYRYYLQEMRNFKPHTLSEAEEKVINIKNITGPAALQRLFDTITSRYTFELEVDGERKTGLTRDAIMKYVYSPNPDLRARAYQTLYAKYSEEAPILGQIYQSLVRDWHNENIGMRHFETPMAVRNLRNDIPDEVVDTLLEVTSRNAGIFQRFFKLKAKWLGMEKIRRYDIYAPVVSAEKTFSYDQAAQMTFASFQAFEPEIETLARRVLDENHVDSEVRSGKTGGAFCWSPVPGLTPWVLLNFTGEARDIATLAHELGHAIHSMLAAHHPIFTSHASLPLAETASTFGEILLIDHLLEHETDESVRRDLLFSQMDDAYAVIVRQVFFATFERQAHEMIQAGASVDELAEAYFENLQEQFGESLELSEEFKWEWVTIPHFYQTPFYVYAYAFGQLLVLALYQQYQEEGEAFKARYLDILRAGGSDAPVEILRGAGIDVTSEAFWQGGFDVLEDMLQKLEAIPQP